jgi:hypothetical protein
MPDIHKQSQVRIRQQLTPAVVVPVANEMKQDLLHMTGLGHYLARDASTSLCLSRIHGSEGQYLYMSS